MFELKAKNNSPSIFVSLKYGLVVIEGYLIDFDNFDSFYFFMKNNQENIKNNLKIHIRFKKTDSISLNKFCETLNSNLIQYFNKITIHIFWYWSDLQSEEIGNKAKELLQHKIVLKKWDIPF